MSQPISTKPPGGMRDFLAPDVARRRHVVGVIQRVYESFGFVPLETPTIENLSTLLGKYGPEGDQLLYRVLHRREKFDRAVEQMVQQRRAPSIEPSAENAPGAGFSQTAQDLLADEGLRYDLTVPLARVVANYHDLPAYYKRYQIQPVWRADRPAKGRFREFWQCDVDVTGTKSLVADAEVCGAVATVLHELGFVEFEIHLNHRDLLRALVAEAGIAPEMESLALIALDKLDKVGVEGVKQELTEKGIGAERGAALLAGLEAARSPGFLESCARAALKSRAPIGATKTSNEDASASTSAGATAAAELVELLATIADGPAAKHTHFDPTLARGLSYYTGPIFEITVPGIAGSIGGGGRYDNLVGMFTKKQIPAVGFSLGLERVLLVMEERGMFDAASVKQSVQVGPQLLLCRFADVPASAAVAVATKLRASRKLADGREEPGLRVELFAETPSLGKQIGYANTIGAPFVGILGGNELAQNTLTLKKLATGEQKTLPIDDVANFVRS